MGGGVMNCSLHNCIVYLNTCANAPNYVSSDLNYCCTTPVLGSGPGCIANNPLFIDYAGGDLRLQPNSPCINSGHNADVAATTDLEGNRRIASGTVDIGAYEYQGVGSMISYAWLQQYSLATDGSVDAFDADGDGHTAWQEWRCGTCPTNALSVLRLLSVTPGASSVTVCWQSTAGVRYGLEGSTNLAAPFLLLTANITGQAGSTTYTHTNATGAVPFFYRVFVQER
jgi:hypothetical protein